jgi:hypothetical protein
VEFSSFKWSDLDMACVDATGKRHQLPAPDHIMELLDAIPRRYVRRSRFSAPKFNRRARKTWQYKAYQAAVDKFWKENLGQ